MRITFLCSPATGDAWTPRTMERGLGGSEEAVVHMATTLASRGHHVSVHNTTEAASRWFGKVEYGCYEALLSEPVDVCVVWRRPSLLTRFRITQSSGRAYLWPHDLVAQDNVIEHAHRYRKILGALAISSCALSQACRPALFRDIERH